MAPRGTRVVGARRERADTKAAPVWVPGPDALPGCGVVAACGYLKKAMPSSGRSPRSFAHSATSSGLTTFLRWADM